MIEAKQTLRMRLGLGTRLGLGQDQRQHWREWWQSRKRNHLGHSFLFGLYSMRPDDCLQIERALEARWNSRTTTNLLVELGSGACTVFLSKLMTRLGGRIISIEDDKQWYWKTHELLAKHCCRNYALHFIPTRNYSTQLDSVEREMVRQNGILNDGDFSWFNIDELRPVLDGQHIDILLVDNGLGAPNRWPALQFLWRHLQGDALVFLHDTKRDGERQLVKEWSRFFQHTTTYDTELGLTMFVNPRGHLI